MPKIADIQETPNPNAVKFILKEPVSHGTSHSFKSAESAADDKFAHSIFEVGSVVSVFYMDKMVTVEKTDDAEWDEILPELAVPIRAADPVASSAGKGAAAMVGGAMIPLFVMPPWMLQLSNLSPVKWAVLGIEGAIWRGFSFAEMATPVAILLATGVLCGGLGAWRITRQPA